MNNLIDRWSLVHFAFWFVVGANFHMLSLPLWVQLCIVAIGAVGWELIEIVLEKKDIIRGREVWYDRWVSDIFMAVFGAAVGMYWVSVP